MPDKQLSYVVLASDCGRVDILVARITKFSRARVRGLIDHGGVSVNGERLGDHGQMLAAGDQLTLRYDPERKYKEKPVERTPHGFTVVFCDEDLVVVEKAAGLLTVPTDQGGGRSLVELLGQHLQRGQKRRGGVAVVHRLDRETSGLLVFGRSPPVAKQLSQQFAARKPEREYAAIVSGVLLADVGTIRSNLQTDAALNQRSAAVGELAITHFTVLTRYSDATLVAVRLETGRRNQIRVHMAELGHPVVGDQRYQAAQAAHPHWPYQRLALHARVLGFRHPVTGATLRFEAALPGEFNAFARKQGR